MSLHISDTLILPLEVVTMTQGILARKRSGKSYTAQKLAEEMLAAGQQIVAIDPTSAWWGLRSSADGSGPGFPVVVFGGEHADVPLDHRSGAMLAAAVVEHGFSAIFDVGEMDVEEQVIFGADFCRELLKRNRNAMHLFMDEAHNWAPQNPVTKHEKHALGAVKRLVLQGGIRGIGFTMISQRTALINKDVLSQVDLLTVLRMSHPLDIKAVTDWIKSEVNVDFAKEVEKALPSLPVGTAFFSSAPLGLGQRIMIAPKSTFNSGATPKPGEREAVPKVLAPIDITSLGKQIAAAAEEQQANSPEALKRRIATLEGELAKKGGQMVDQKAIDAAVSAERREHERFRQSLSVKLVDLGAEMGKSQQAQERVKVALGAVLFLLEVKDQPTPALTEQFNLVPIAAPVVTSGKYQVNSPAAAGSSLGKAQRLILSTLATYGSCTKRKTAAISGYSVTSGSFRNTLSELRVNGWMVGADPIEITAAGRQALGCVDPLPSGNELLQMWLGKLDKCAREILIVLAKHRTPLSKEQIGAQTGYEFTSGSFRNALSQLRTLELIEGSGILKLTDDFAQAVRS